MERFIRGHPNSTYAQSGRGGFKPNAYDCVQEGRGVQGCVRAQKKIVFGPQNLKTFLFFFLQKKLLHCHLLLGIEKCKP